MTEVSNRSVGRALEIIKLLSSHESPLGLKDIAEGRAVGDTTTLADPDVVRKLKERYEDEDKG